MEMNSTIGNICEVLKEVQGEGGFFTTVVSTSDGLSLAAVDSNYDNDNISAIVSRIQRVVKQVEVDLDLSKVDEVTLLGGNKIRLVGRYFLIGEHRFVLAVMVPPHKSYRLIMNRAMRKIVPLLSQSLMRQQESPSS